MLCFDKRVVFPITNWTSAYYISLRELPTKVITKTTTSNAAAAPSAVVSATTIITTTTLTTTTTFTTVIPLPQCAARQ